MAWQNYLSQTDRQVYERDNHVSKAAARMALETLARLLIRTRVPPSDHGAFDSNWTRYRFIIKRNGGMNDIVITAEDIVAEHLAQVDYAFGGPAHAVGDWLDNTAADIQRAVRQHLG